MKDRKLERTITDITINQLTTYQLIPSGILENSVIEQMQIDNRSATVDLKLYYNGSSEHVDVVPAGTSRIIQRPFSWVAIENLDGSNKINAGDLIITLYNYLLTGVRDIE